MDLLEKTLKSIEAPLVLDVATGNGNFARFLKKEYQGIGTIVGTDISRKGLKGFRDIPENNGNMLPLCMNSSEMAFPDASLDMVCISNSLHHLANLDDTLREMMRVYSDRGGYFLVSEMYCDNQTEAQMTHVLMHEWWASIDTLRGVPHFSTFTRDNIFHLCERLGLDELIAADYSLLDSDPKNEKIMEHLNGAIDTYISRIEDIEDNSELAERGEELRERLYRVGFHGASNLSVLGRKP